MSIRTRTVESPGRVARRVQAAERVKSGAAQRAYAKRKMRAEQRADAGPRLPTRRSVMAARIPFVAAIIAMLGCGLALTLLLTTRAAEDSYQLSDARELNRKLSEERAALQREVEAADSAPELAARARELGMIPARDPARLVIGPDGTVTVIGKETPAQGAPAPPLNVTPSARPSAQPGHAQAQGERVVPVSTTPARPSGEQANGNTPSPTPAAPPVPGAVASQPSPLPPPPAEVPQPAAQNPAAPDPAAAPQPGAQDPAVAPDPAASQPVAQVPADQQLAPPGAQVAPQDQPGGTR
ncbi:hypothetical protein [Nocardia amikacinitolerans]|uniref:hypothetical protein n=1 Tax=Nocardia amikacinitolerans TaxID=756689 RepID=UPI0020A51973|nr:hypothetical protein [Nocardia amikacinitolerans]MCP2293431.1 hypothetical protein [Nocardia amikacinitolerans]